MREDKIKSDLVVNQLTEQVWKCTDVLHKTRLRDRVDILLFLITALRDNWDISWTELRYVDKIDSYSNNIQSQNLNELDRRIFDIYSPLFTKLPSYVIVDLSLCITNIDTHALRTHFAEVFENILQRVIEIKGKSSGESVLPKEVTRLIIDLAQLDSNASVYNPFAGLASFGVNLNEGQTYFGQEINSIVWAIGQLRLKAHNREHSSEYVIGDSIEYWYDFQKYDLIVSAPPLKLPIPKEFHSNLTGDSYGDVESFLIDKGIHSIKADGQFIGVFSLSFLFGGGRQKRLRHNLIENCLIDTIINLPAGLLSNTAIPLCIVVFKVTSRRPGYIKLVDGSTFFRKEGSRKKVLNEKELKDLINTDVENEFLRYVSDEEIYANDLDLSVGRYFLKSIDGFKLHAFSRIIKGEKAPLSTRMKQVQIRDLKKDVFDCVLNTYELESSLVSRNSFRIISESCLLLATKWNTLKPTYFEYSGEPIVVSSAIVALKLDEDEVDPIFLINEFSADYVEDQLNKYRVGSVQPMLRNNDLIKIVIKLPSIQEQRAKVKGILELSEKFKILQEERNRLAHGEQVSSFDEFASLKHSLGTPRQNILSNAKSLIRFFENNDSSAFSEVKDLYNERYNTNLIDDLVQIKNDVNHISTILEKGENGLVMSDYELSAISIKDLNQLLNKLKKVRENYTFHYERALAEEMKNKAIRANLTLFQILLDNILSNANKYAFREKSGLNLLVVELKVTEEVMQLEIRNNGLPFPNNFNRDKFISKFSTSNEDNGSGLGGYDINRIAKYFNNPDWELILDENSVFPVIFRFNFPVIPILNE
ncbi:N-6 DNA methylase [Mangrovimonas aestuarii]|uniref:N-6 DNA methylase n=1 Tax=Mangrovimonas aestuarii TaxID=3018443 RepID=UPI0023788ABE|nr:N-6 DNA methylase [Mangrovimonas aestuarii]